MPRPFIFAVCLALVPLSTLRAEPPAQGALARGARTVLAAVVEAAERNRRLPVRGEADDGPFRHKGDELTETYVRAAARAARRLPAEQRAPAFLLALGIALDDSDLIRNNPLTRDLWRRVEPDADRARRLRVLGEPTVRGRHDLAQHFSVSAALTAVHGKTAAEAAGILKEMLDARPGGSGFSFADLAADFAGVAFAERLVRDPDRLAGVEQAFRVADYTLTPRGLPEGLSQADFSRRYGSTRDERFRKEVAALRKRLSELPGFGADRKP
jgi:hypothetical protein